uniref:Uncharacterized protein n=1 Tax=Gadus morhua TaxID=8049 RepID=A0A8C5B7V2_GADMO
SVLGITWMALQTHLAWLYYQYLLVTGVYVLEPWERALFTSVLLSAAAMVGYTSYVFLPLGWLQCRLPKMIIYIFSLFFC